jgi:hypothetical protein
MLGRGRKRKMTRIDTLVGQHFREHGSIEQ